MTINKTDNKRKFLFKSLAAFGVVCGISYSAYYYFISSNHVTTDNAYVGAEVAQIAASTGGIIKQINFSDTQFVNEGEVLVVIDDADAKLALAIAKANFSKAEAELQRAKTDLRRREALVKSGSVSGEELTNAQNQYKASQALHEATKVAVDQAKLDLERVEVKSPISGVVARRQVQLGQKVPAGAFLMSVTPTDKMHVDANFKEVQLRKVRIGQPVEITADLYGDGVVYHGKVLGFSGGTGSAFAAIPAQNATGNWIKVVQRLPIRIELLAEELKEHPLQVGLSMHVDIDVSKN